MPRGMSSRERFFLLVTILLAIPFGGLMIMKPLSAQMEVLKDKIRVEETKLIKDQKLIQAAKLKESQYRPYLEQIQQTRSDEQMKSSINAQIDQVAKDLGLQLLDIKPNPVRKEKYSNTFAVTLTVNCDLLTIVQFLHILQTDPHNFAVDELRLDKATRRDSSEVKMRLVLSKILVLPAP